MISFFRVIKFAFQDMFRNFSLSIMTVLILILMLMSINTVIFIRVLTAQATTTIKDQIDVSVYFDHRATEKQIDEMRKYVTSFPEVVDSKFLTKEETLEQFKLTYADNPKIINALSELGENPLGSMLVVKTREPGDYKKIIQALNVPEYKDIVEARTFEDTEKAIERIDTITKNVEEFSLALSAFFALIAFIIIFNTIRVSIYTQRIEISIKKLVGATNWFIRGPYIIESLFFSALSTAITAAAVVFAARWLDPYVGSIFQKPGFLTEYLFSHIVLLFAYQFLAVLLLTIFSTVLAMRKHLKV